jgi:hypothetical protein
MCFNFIKAIMPSSRTGKDPLVCRMRDDSKCLYRPIPLGDLTLTHWMRHKIYKHRKKPAIIDTPRHDKKLIVIMPCRHRDEHLKIIPAELKKFLAKQNITNEIFVIEQADRKPFNKGKILNVGFSLTKDRGDYFCFHDIDMLPEVASYAYVNHPVLLANSISQFDVRKNHETYFGGVILFRKEDYIKMNGFSNNYWHWGYEDDDSHLRCLLCGLTPLVYSNGRYISQDHITSRVRTADGVYHKDEPTVKKLHQLYIKNKKRYKKVRRGITDVSKEGLNTLKYKIVKQEKFPLYTKIAVEL